MPKLKICRVQSSRDAHNLIELGADYLGFHMLTDSELTNTFHPFHTINRQLVREEGFLGGVLLTKSTSVDCILHGIRLGDFRILQLHWPAPLSVWRQIRAQYPTSQDLTLIAVVDPNSDPTCDPEELLQVVDFILTDSLVGGTGRLQGSSAGFNVDPSKRFLAGGVNSTTIQDLPNVEQMAALDVQSGAECPPKTKNYLRVRELVKLVKGSGPVMRAEAKTPRISFAPHGLDPQSIERCSQFADRIHLDIGLTEDQPLRAEDYSGLWQDHLLEFHVFHPAAYVDGHPDWMRCIPQNAALVVLQVDGAELEVHGSDFYLDLLNELERQGLTGGLAVNANTKRTEWSEAMLVLLRSSAVRDIQIMGPLGSRQEVSNAITATYGLLSGVRHDYRIGIDRGVGLPVLQAICSEVPLARIVLGRALAAAESAAATINASRRLAGGRI